MLYDLILAMKGNPAIFKAYCKMLGRYRDDLFPDSETDLHITGYPRSGNTFATALANDYAGHLNLATHMHTTATLRVARQYHIPTIILFRDPTQAISSAWIKQRKGVWQSLKQEQRIREYCWYYEYVLEHLPDCKLLHFKRLVETPESLITLIAALMGDKVMPPSEFDLQSAEDKSIEKLKSDDSPPNENDWHNEEKERLKKEARTLIEQTPAFKAAQTMYDKLLTLEEDQWKSMRIGNSSDVAA